MPTPILLLVRELTAGGSERQLTEIAKHLDRSRWQPHVGSFHDSGPRAEELRQAGVPLVRFPVHSFASLSVLAGARSLGRYLRQHRIQLVHSFDVPMNIFGVFASRFYRCPAVLSSQRAFRSLVLPRQRRLLRLTDRLVDGVVVNCEALRRHLAEEENVPAARIHLCYNGLDLPRFTAPPGELRPPALRDSSLVIGCACVLRPEKGLATLLSAFAIVRPLRPGLKLVLLGSGQMRDELVAQAQQLGISEAVHFEPATGDVGPWMRAMDIFVLPSLSEALSNSLMEAMFSGCAAVASRVGGNPELVQDGRTGLTFPPGDAAALAACLQILIANDARRHEMAAAGQHLIRDQFSITSAAQRMGQIYNGILAHQQNPSRQE